MQPVILNDDVVMLSVPVAADLDAVTAACQDRAIQAWTAVPSPYRRADAETFIEQVVPHGWAEDLQHNWAIRADGELVGMVGLARQPAASAEIGYWLARPARGHGLAHRALLLVLAWAFDEESGPHLDRVEWQAYAGNWPSWRTAWRLGFRFEGVSRGGAVQREVRRDGWHGSLLRDDARAPTRPWPATSLEAPQPPEG